MDSVDKLRHQILRTAGRCRGIPRRIYGNCVLQREGEIDEVGRTYSDRRPLRGCGLIPPLGRRAWWLLAGYTAQKIGSGLIFPFLVVYMVEVRGIGLGTASLVIAAGHAAGVFAVPIAGMLVDRVGAGRSAALAMLVAVAGSIGYAVAGEPAVAFGAAALLGAGTAGMWNAFVSVLAAAVRVEQRGNVFGVAFALQNLGFGLGAAAGGVIVASQSPASFTLAFLVTGALYLVFVAVLVTRGEVERPAPVPPRTGSAAGRSLDGERTTAGYPAVLADRPFLGVAVLNAIFAAITVVLLDTAFPAWATGPAGASTRAVGLAFSANTFVIVAAQLFVLRYLLEGRRRTRAIAASALVSGAACVITLLAGKAGDDASATAGLVAALAVFGLGQTLAQPSLYALVNDLAPDPLRGRYNAVFNLSWQAGQVIGPAAAAAVLGLGRFELLFAGLAATCCLAAALAMAFERAVPATVNLIGCHSKGQPLP